MNYDYYTKIHSKVISLFKDGYISYKGLSLYVLCCSNSKDFKASRAYLLSRGFKRRVLEKAESELALAGLIKIKRGKGGRSYTEYDVLSYDEMKDYEIPAGLNQDGLLVQKDTVSKRYSVEMNKLQCQNEQATVSECTSVRVQNDTLIINKNINNNIIKREQVSPPSKSSLLKFGERARSNLPLNVTSESIEKEYAEDTKKRQEWVRPVEFQYERFADAAELWKNLGTQNKPIEDVISELKNLVKTKNVPLNYIEGVRKFICWDVFWLQHDLSVFDLKKYWSTICKQYETTAVKHGDFIPRFDDKYRSEHEVGNE